MKEQQMRDDSPATLLKVTKHMRDLGVASFEYGSARVVFWQMPSTTPKLDLKSVDPGADTANYTDLDLFGDAEDPDRMPDAKLK